LSPARKPVFAFYSLGGVLAGSCSGAFGEPVVEWLRDAVRIAERKRMKRMLVGTLWDATSTVSRPLEHRSDVLIEE